MPALVKVRTLPALVDWERDCVEYFHDWTPPTGIPRGQHIVTLAHPRRALCGVRLGASVDHRTPLNSRQVQWALDHDRPVCDTCRTAWDAT